MPSITIRRPEAPIRAMVQLPRSKSISNRALICASLVGDLSCVRHISDADDTRILQQLLKERSLVMHCGLGGTTYRFLLAWACIQEGEEHVITGEPPLLERPHDALVNALRSLGAGIERVDEGYRVRGRKLKGGTVELDSPISSQFISGLMLIAPVMEEGLRIEWKGRRLSEPYVRMTSKVMRHFGADVRERGGVIAIAPGSYRAASFTVQPDWSAAAFWYELVGLTGDAIVTLNGLEFDGWQGDEAIDVFARPFVVATTVAGGVQLRSKMIAGGYGLAFDLSGMPDLFQPLALLCAGNGQASSFTGLDNLSLKESDRIAAVADVLGILGSKVDRNDQWLWTHPFSLPTARPAEFDPRGDHRMAMALAPLALVRDRVTILDPDVVNKSYPRYWDDLSAAGFRVERS